MDPTKLLEDLTWADPTIVGDDLKAVQDFDMKTLKNKELYPVCSWLKIKGVKKATKEQMIQKLVRPIKYSSMIV